MQATVNADDIIAAGKKRFKNAAGSFVAEQCKNADALFMESYITQVFGILPELVTRNANIARDTLTEGSVQTAGASWFTFSPLRVSPGVHRGRRSP